MSKMMRLNGALIRKTAALPAALALMFVAACVDPSVTAGSANRAALPKPGENVYVAAMDAGIQIPALPVEEIPESHRRQVVEYETDQVPGTIIINPKTKHLYYVLGHNKAIRYGIAVGRAGFEWSGEANVAEKKEWPTWIPPKEMIARRPELAKFDEVGQPGGPTNPLGARAIYLNSNGRDYGYRIHGTPEWETIGHNASSGCIRMINQDVIDLYGRVQGGEKVIVLTASGEMPKGLYIPPTIAPKKPEPEIPAGAIPTLAVLPPPSIATGGATVAPAAAPAAAAPAPTPTPPAATEAPVTDEGKCKVALVNGTCPPDQVMN